MTIDSPDWNQA